MFCRKHWTKTPEHQAKINAALKGKVRTPRPPSLKPVFPRKCEYCGKDFAVPKLSRKDRFCSRQCGYLNRRGNRAPNWKGEKPTFHCLECQRPFRAGNFVTKRKHCSYRCASIAKRKAMPNRRTKIELMVADAMKKLGIKFKEQFTVRGVCIADFLIPKSQTLVFCDGDYWHNLPGRPEKDKRQTLECERRGFIVMRFWETEIKRDVISCVRRLLPTSLFDILDK